MKRVVLTVLAVAALAFGAYSQTGDGEGKSDLPEITFTSTEIDYGEVPQNSEGARSFEFTNTGKAPLLLTNVSASCGCTVVEWAKAPIKPGEKGSLTVRYNTAIVGTFSKTISVFTNAQSSHVLLIIKGNVKPLQEAPTQSQQ